MHFVKLRLTGFKSFVDPTDFPIEPGLTGVIGPNGCGKSNLLEALRWVMGETSAKSMRGSGMEDVIFNGASTRPPRNYAEVSLHIDNTERRAPPTFNDADQMEITRRIAREMGSSYRCNGREIRARDAQTLFADAATGANSPALVRQGQITELINAKPRARRRILEDAAGIAGLHARRHEAMLRLNTAETNLQRVVEVLTQLEAREATLKREADRAERYRSLSKELRLSEAILAFRRWREADRDAANADQAIAERKTIEARATQAAAEAARALAAFEEKIPALREDEAIARALHQKAEIERRSLDQRETEARRAAERAELQLRQLTQDRAREETIRRDAAEMLERIVRERDALAAESADPEAEARALEAAQAAEAEAAEAVRVAEARLDRLNADAAKRAAERDAATARAAEAKAQLARLDREAAEAAERKQALADARAMAEETAEEARMAAEEAAAAIEEAEAEALAAEETRAEAEARASAARSDTGEIEGHLKALTAEAAALERTLAARAAAAEPVLAHARAAAGVEAAFDAAFGETLRLGLAGEDGASGWRDLGALTPPPPLPEGVRPLSEEVEAPAALARRLSQTGLLDDPRDGPRLQAALAPGQSLVDRDGALWRWDGLTRAAGEGESAAALELKSRNRLEALAAEQAETEERFAAASAALTSASAAARAGADADARAREARRAAERRSAEAAEAARRADAEIGRQKAQIAAVEEVLSARAVDRAEAEAAVEAAAELEAEIVAALEAGAAGAEEDPDAARAAVERARAAMMEARAAREGVEQGRRARGARAESLARDAASWESRLEAAGAQLEALERRVEDASSELEAAKLAPEEIAEAREALAEASTEAETRLAAAVDALTGAETEMKTAAKTQKAAEEMLAGAREERARLEARTEASQERAAELTVQLRDISGVEPEEFLEKLDLDPETLPIVKDLERAIVQLRQSREKLGAVNLRAAQELDEVSTERAKLAQEREDLEAAIAKLRQGVSALNREGRERLLAAYEEVNRNFTALFTHLFDGGDAKLVLVESDDPLEAGLEILCQPPGKRLASLSLLSGGEQTLTAISLIFAVFMVNPAPICVLDEVDAPLDDANVGRFCDLLDEMTRRTRTRFVIITHHAVSMSRMNRLFGVTMAEKGVSQLVSVDLGAAVDLVAA